MKHTHTFGALTGMFVALPTFLAIQHVSGELASWTAITGVTVAVVIAAHLNFLLKPDPVLRFAASFFAMYASFTMMSLVNVMQRGADPVTHYVWAFAGLAATVLFIGTALGHARKEILEV